MFDSRRIISPESGFALAQGEPHGFAAGVAGAPELAAALVAPATMFVSDFLTASTALAALVPRIVVGVVKDGVLERR